MNYRQQQQHVTVIGGGLKEELINTKDLIEVETESYKEMKEKGMTPQQIRSIKNQKQAPQNLNFNVGFVPPKNDNYVKKQIYLPKKGQRYNELKAEVKKNLINYAQKQQQQQRVPIQNNYQHQTQPISQTRYVNTGPQTTKVVKRYLQKANGEVVELGPNDSI